MQVLWCVFGILLLRTIKEKKSKSVNHLQDGPKAAGQPIIAKLEPEMKHLTTPMEIGYGTAPFGLDHGFTLTGIYKRNRKKQKYLHGQFLYFPNAATAIKDSLFLHNTSISNKTIKDCSWRPLDSRLQCPDQDVTHILYTAAGERQVVDPLQSDWLRQSSWDPTKEDVMLIHGYAGGDDTLPMVVLRDAYIQNGSYNVWIVDWGPLSEPPCYASAVHNIKAIAKCTGQLLTALRHVGLNVDRFMCVGHSLGAHTCGLIAKSVLFRIHRIMALDPARPLIAIANRLNSGDASAVHVIHTNAGHYGEAGRSGHVDFCVNGGRIQPYCQNVGFDEQLCSHVWAICYMAESLHVSLAKRAEPCSRRCPTGPRPGHRIGTPVLMGQFTPLVTSGSYCVYNNEPPYCPVKPGDLGDKRCCLQYLPPELESGIKRKG